ncbi:MAG: helix-turn-helix transcriptional regulator [Candidatus Omnitrophota bacterium]
MMKKIILTGNIEKTQKCDLKNIGLRIQYARKDIGLSQSMLADKIGIHVVSLSKIESGKVNTTIETLCRIAEVTNKPMSYFFGEEPKQMYNSDVDDLKKQIAEIKEDIKKYQK